MITRSWTENWKHRLQLALALSFLAAVVSAIYPATKFNETTKGWYGAYLHSWLLADTVLGDSGRVAKLNLPPKQWQQVVCGSDPKTCDLYDAKTRKFFITYPSISGASTAALFFLLLPVGWLKKRKSDEEHRRGARVVEGKELAKQLRGEPAHIVLGGVPFPRRDETRHLLLAGSPGSGKTVAFNTILKAIRARGDRAIVVDAGGAFLQRFARQGDVLLNPFDKRSRPWSPFAEATTTGDIEVMARSLIPAGEDSNKVWQDLAKTVLAGLMEQCAALGIGNNHSLASLATSGNQEWLAKVLKGHPAESLVASGSPATIGSILTNLGEAAAGLRYLQPDAGGGAFSIRHWVQEGTGWMFLSFQVSQREALKHILSAQLDLVARTVLDLEPDEQRRVWLIVDELPLLGKVVGALVEFLTNGRRFGGCAVLGIQAISQLRETYGREGAATMLSCLSSQLVLRSADGETAEQMSRMLGEAEILRRSRSQGKTEQGTSQNEQEQVTQTRAVMAAELQNLADLHGYLSLIGDRPVARIKLEIPNVPNGVNPPFVPAQMPERRPFVLPPHLLIDDGEPKATPTPKPEPQPAGDNADWRTQIEE
jgi:type IV secretory pathway TraG/TraD family ATPase VirD4